jgi:hypothetical protein
VIFFFLFFLSPTHLGHTGIWTSDCTLTRQVFYWLSHSSTSLCSDYFGDRVLLFAQAGLVHSSSILCFPPSLGWHAHTTMPNFFPLRWALANFFGQAGLEPWSFQSHPVYRHEPPAPDPRYIFVLTWPVMAMAICKPPTHIVLLNICNS